MAIGDLREWIERVDELGELTRVRGADPARDVGGLTDLYMWEMGNPALLFDDLVGHPPGYRVLSNVHTSLRRVALTLGLPTTLGTRAFVEALRDRLAGLEPMAARIVDAGPVLDHRQVDDAVDVTRFPAPVWHPGDGGGYLGTGCIVIMRRP